MSLSPHFTLREMTRTSHTSLQDAPSETVVEQLRRLCVEVLEPLRGQFGPLVVSSGYRSAQLNRHIGGARTSAHLHGRAADVIPLQYADVDGDGDRDDLDLELTIARMVRWLQSTTLPWDQVIDEAAGRKRWLHIGMARPGRQPRRQALLYRDGKYAIFRER